MPHTYPHRFPFSRLRFNPVNAWPAADLKHSDIMARLSMTTPRTTFARYHFRLNEDGTITPLMRAHEWELAALMVGGRKTFSLR